MPRYSPSLFVEMPGMARSALLTFTLLAGCAAGPKPEAEPRCAEALARAGIEPDRAVVACEGRR